MIAMLWLLGCGPAWTERGAVSPTLARIDQDGDGRVSSTEYAAVNFRGAPFSDVDVDHDGSLSPDELLASVLENDPANMTVSRSGAQVNHAGKSTKPRKAEARTDKPENRVENRPADEKRIRSETIWVVRNILLSLREEVLSVTPNAAVPTEDELRFAAGTGDIRTAESRELLGRLEVLSDAAGLDFPAGLRASALAEVPVVASVDPEALPTSLPPADGAQHRFDPKGGPGNGPERGPGSEGGGPEGGPHGPEGGPGGPGRRGGPPGGRGDPGGPPGQGPPGQGPPADGVSDPRTPDGTP